VGPIIKMVRMHLVTDESGQDSWYDFFCIFTMYKLSVLISPVTIAYTCTSFMLKINSARLALNTNQSISETRSHMNTIILGSINHVTISASQCIISSMFNFNLQRIPKFCRLRTSTKGKF